MDEQSNLNANRVPVNDHEYINYNLVNAPTPQNENHTPILQNVDPTSNVYETFASTSTANLNAPLVLYAIGENGKLTK